MNNGAALTIGSTGSITGDLTVNAGASFTNNGTVNTPGVWQAEPGHVRQQQRLSGQPRQCRHGHEHRNVDRLRHQRCGLLVRQQRHRHRQCRQHGRPGRAAAAMSAAWPTVVSSLPAIRSAPRPSPGNFSQSSTGTFLTEVCGRRLERPHHVGGTATLGGQVLGERCPGMSFAPSNDLHHPQRRRRPQRQASRR